MRYMTSSRRWVVSSLLAAVVLAACSSGSKSSHPPVATTASTTSSALSGTTTSTKSSSPTTTGVAAGATTTSNPPAADDDASWTGPRPHDHAADAGPCPSGHDDRPSRGGGRRHLRRDGRRRGVSDDAAGRVPAPVRRRAPERHGLVRRRRDRRRAALAPDGRDARRPPPRRHGAPGRCDLRESGPLRAEAERWHLTARRLCGQRARREPGDLRVRHHGRRDQGGGAHDLTPSGCTG